MLFFGAGEKAIVLDYMGRLRLKLGHDLNLIDPDAFDFLWVVDFPMFERVEGKLSAMHHPFTMPKEIDSADPEEAQSIAYDIVLNGVELEGEFAYPQRNKIQKSL